jgi:peroxiredoxin Q/BCP
MSRRAPDFKLLDQDGNERSLSDYAGRWLVVFFYPLDGSLNCTLEVCAFRDEHAIIGQFGNADVVGINKGSVASHKRFASKNRLNFPLLSDSTRAVTKAFGAWRASKAHNIFDKAFGTRRNTYIINPEGEIVKEFRGVRAQNHVSDVIQTLQSLQNLVPA